jgi:hypothetical protein
MKPDFSSSEWSKDGGKFNPIMGNSHFLGPLV